MTFVSVIYYTKFPNRTKFQSNDVNDHPAHNKKLPKKLCKIIMKMPRADFVARYNTNFADSIVVPFRPINTRTKD